MILVIYVGTYDAGRCRALDLQYAVKLKNKKQKPYLSNGKSCEPHKSEYVLCNY